MIVVVMFGFMSSTLAAWSCWWEKRTQHMASIAKCLPLGYIYTAKWLIIQLELTNLLKMEKITDLKLAASWGYPESPFQASVTTWGHYYFPRCWVHLPAGNDGQRWAPGTQTHRSPGGSDKNKIARSSSTSALSNPLGTRWCRLLSSFKYVDVCNYSHPKYHEIQTCQTKIQLIKLGSRINYWLNYW
jgi:hypothetical protein